MTTWKYGYSRPPLPASTILNLELTPLTVWDTSPSIYYRVAQTSSVTSKYPNSHISTPFPHRINRTLKKKRENRSVNIRRQYIKSSLSSSHPLGGTWNSWRAWRHFWGSVRRSMESGGGERGCGASQVPYLRKVLGAWTAARRGGLGLTVLFWGGWSEAWSWMSPTWVTCISCEETTSVKATTVDYN